MKRGVKVSIREKSRRRRSTEKGRQQGYDSDKRARWRAKLACLVHYGGDPPRCACCGETNIGFLTLDHPDNDGADHRRRMCGHGVYLYLVRQKFPAVPVLQVLCYNCNCGRQRNGGVCPHKEPVTDWQSVRWPQPPSLASAADG